MRIYPLIQTAAITLSAIYLQSCHKATDRNPDPGNIPESKCAITKITRSADNNGTVTYNSAGNPVSVVYETQGYDNNWHYFIYDDSNRLTEYTVELEPGLDIETHRYSYDDN